MLLRLAALLLLSTLVFAQTAPTFIWKAPTEREGGTTITNQEIERYNFYCDGSSAPTHTQENTPTRDEVWEVPADAFEPGEHTCYATTVDTGGLESAPSDSVPFTVAPLVTDGQPPKAPVSLAVQ